MDYYDERNSIIKEHNSNGPQPSQDFIGERDKNRTDAQALASEHGSTYQKPTQTFIGELDPNRTEIQSILDEHGANVYASKEDVYGTSDELGIKIMRVCTLSTSIDPKIIPTMVSKIPNETLFKIMSQRFKKAANIMDDRGITKDKIEELESRLLTDFSIISAAIEQDRGLTDKQIDASLYPGAKPTDLSGLLKQYYISLLSIDKEIGLRGFDGEKIVNEEGKEINAEEYLSGLRKIVKTKNEMVEEPSHSMSM